MSAALPDTAPAALRGTHYDVLSMASPFGDLPVRRAGTGEPLLLLHGGAGSWTHWSRNIPVLARHYCVFALDLPGCGDSPDVDDGVDADSYVATVAEAISGFSAIAGRFRLCGFSFGGATAAGVAARLGERVSQLALVAPGGFGAPRGRMLDLLRVPFKSNDDAAINSALRHNLAVMMFADSSRIDDQTIALHRDNVRRARYDSRRMSLSTITIRSLSAITAPVHIIWGDRDNLAYPSVTDRAATARTLRPEVQISYVPGGGHWVQHEAADAVNDLLLDFFSDDHNTEKI